MTAPTVVSLTKYGSSAAAAAHSITLPTVNEGDTLLVMFTYRSNLGVTWDQSKGYFTLLGEGGVSTCSVHVRIRKCTGAESGQTLSINLGATVNASCLIYRITGASGRFAISSRVGATATTADPGAATVDVAWGAKDYLSVAFCGYSLTAESFSSYPTGYAGDYTLSTAGSGNVVSGVAYKALTAATTENPDAFTATASGVNSAYTILVEPDSASADFAYIRSQADSRTTTNGTAHTITMPPSVKSGDELHVYAGFDANPTISAWDDGSWTQVSSTSNSTNNILYHYKKTATGAEEGGSISVTTGTSEQGVFVAVAVKTSLSESATPSTGNSTAPDSPSVTPSWGAANSLGFSVMSGDNGAGITTITAPTGYSSFNFSLAGGTGNVFLGFAAKEFTGSSEDPAAWTVDLAETWVATTTALKVAAAAGGSTSAPYVHPIPQRNYRHSGRFVGR